MLEKNYITMYNKRLDGRLLSEGRTLEIFFSEKDRGSCIVLQGSTRVFVNIDIHISEPKLYAPYEGIIQVNLELSPMSAPDAKNNSRSERFIEARRILDRCIRNSVDLESLCIVAASKVWTIDVNIHVLNDGGNQIECASVAAISALAHFRLPAVTVVGTDVTIHSKKEKETIPLSINTIPLAINMALFKGTNILIDPTEIEEQICDGSCTFVVNAHREFFLRHCTGHLKDEEIIRCENIALERAGKLTETILSALDGDKDFKGLIQTGTTFGGSFRL